jgi:hypothetical protein
MTGQGDWMTYRPHPHIHCFEAPYWSLSPVIASYPLYTIPNIYAVLTTGSTLMLYWLQRTILLKSKLSAPLQMSLFTDFILSPFFLKASEAYTKKNSIHYLGLSYNKLWFLHTTRKTNFNTPYTPDKITLRLQRQIIAWAGSTWLFISPFNHPNAHPKTRSATGMGYTFIYFSA